MRILVHSFLLGDVDDPEIYAAEPILEFERSEKGQWLTKHSYQQMTYDVLTDYQTYGYRVVLHAWLNEQDLTYYTLKWR
jgi:hypothetical protein